MDVVVELWQRLFSADVLLGAGETLLLILIVLIISRILLQVASMTVDRLFRIEDPEKPSRFGRLEAKRAQTLRTLTMSIVRYTIYFVAGVMVLERLGLNISSILAAAGIAGLAVGFGAQNLVRDIVTGFFLLFEEQFSVGDYVTAGGVSGVVESMGIRVTRIRDFGGELHIVPNGQITQVTNHMGDAMRVMFTVAIAYEADVNRAMGVLEEMFAELRASGELPDVMEGPAVLGVQELGDSGVGLLIWGKAKPMTQWAMTREIRKRVKLKLDETGIEIPYPRRYLIFDRDRRETGQVGEAEHAGPTSADADTAGSEAADTERS